ncbi:hypothetical protein MIND_00520800 [Mycena indigotica]|uniref:PNK3P-domain-containing protein n=1 Tax=Mycena indigotica TaxID=2126181 RepID=A0A8H6SZ20_9AGAR|nr:uncharacterized protein MIND_00520800 [Mycena indigotica]KAF7307271.1 hypothetical protein MIND_00520800 [Mycena indigotica]
MHLTFAQSILSSPRIEVWPLNQKHLEPQPSKKVATFDLDGTVIASLSFKAPKLEWRWWHACVPVKLRQAVTEGYSVVLITNQNGLKSEKQIREWKQKIALIAANIPDVPFRILAAVAKDNYRKPMIGMWQAIEAVLETDVLKIDKSASFFVGDFAGRTYPGTDRKKDHAGTDRKWALNVGIPFLTPEEYFLGEEPHASWELTGFHPSSLRSLPLFTPNSSPLLPPKPLQELVLFVGYPCLGKTTLFRTHFQDQGYLHVNQDTLKTREKCVKTVAEALEAGQKCVVDNTNRDVSTRRFYLDVAKKYHVPVRCMVFTGSFELAWHNNIYRAYYLPKSVAEREPVRELLPISAFTSFRDAHEEPELEEGFTQIKKINWVWTGTEEDRKVWEMWLQFDDKR